MNRVLKSITCLAALGGVGLSSTASAFLINGVEVEVGAYFDSTTIFENLVTTPGDTLVGIGIVETIRNSGNQVIWQSGDNGTELTFSFEYLLEGAAPLPSGDLDVVFSGGDINFFTDVAGDFDPATGALATSIATATNGTPFLNLIGGSVGRVCGGVGVPPCISAAGTPITLDSTAQGASLATVGSGSGEGFLEVVAGPGAANSFFDTNTQPPPAPALFDITLGSDFFTDQGSSDFDLSGTANLRGVIAVPEPSSLAMFGLGLLGVSFFRLRRKS